MKVLFYNDYSELVGGAETYQADLVAGLKKAGVEVRELFGRKSMPRRNPLLYQFQLLSKGYRILPSIVNRIHAAINQFQPDLIHINNNRVYTRSVCHAIGSFDLPVISMMHDYHFVQPKPGSLLAIKEWIKYQKLQDMIAHTDVFVSPTNLLKQHLDPIEGVKTVKHIPCSIDQDLWKFAPQVTNRPARLLFYGRMVEIKGIFLLPPLMLQLKEEFPTIVLDIIGEGVDRQKLQQEVERLELQQHIRIHGPLPQQEILSYLHQSRVLIVPSIFKEPFGLVGIEAQAAGTPVVASHIGGIPEWCRDEETGLLCKPGDVSSLANQVKRLLTDNALAERLTHQATTFVTETFNREVIIKQMLDLYRQLLHIHPITS